MKNKLVITTGVKASWIVTILYGIAIEEPWND